MAVKCPACGFDSPDAAQWCDFCKEPFAKKAAKQAAPAPSPAPPPASLAPAPPPVRDGRSAPAGKRSMNFDDLPEEIRKRLPPDLLTAHDEESVPAVSNSYRLM